MQQTDRASPAPQGSLSPVVTVVGLRKTYASGQAALKGIDLTIYRGEIFALLGPNGAGKTTLIHIICGIVTPSTGTVIADGHDILRDYRAARSKIGLVPQELHTDTFETVWATVSFSRGLFGRPPDPAHCEKVLRDLALWDRRDAKIMTLSGGMKRRVMIAKALSHEPTILFLDEPTAGVDVELRREMWQLVRRLRDSGVTIILTTHYIEEAEQMADRIGVISKGELIVVEDKDVLMRKLGKKQLSLTLQQPLAALPAGLAQYPLELSADGYMLVFTFDAHSTRDRYPEPAAAPERAQYRGQGSALQRELSRGYLRRPGEGAAMNVHAIRAIYRFEMSRTFRTLMQSIASPVLSTALYFVVFGAAIGARMGGVDGVGYGSFIVPGLIMLSILSESVSNASFGIYLPKWSGTIFELLSAPVSYVEVLIGYVGAAATKSVMLGALILVTARVFVPYEILHPVWMAVFLILTAVSFSLFGFVIGVWAESFEQLQVVPLMILTPLTFLGGAFYSIRMLPPVWQKITLFNPVVYLISGFRWSFFGAADVNVVMSAAATLGFLALCVVAVSWIFKTGYKLKN